MVDAAVGVLIASGVVTRFVRLGAQDNLAGEDEVVIGGVEFVECPAHLAAELDIIEEAHSLLRRWGSRFPQRAVDDGTQQAAYFFRSSVCSVASPWSLSASMEKSSSSSASMLSTVSGRGLPSASSRFQLSICARME